MQSESENPKREPSRENIRKQIIKLTVPVIIEQTSIMALGMVNVIMVGRLGKEAIAAANMVDLLSQVIISFFSALAVGCTVLVARLVGRGDFKRINHVAKQALYAGSILSLGITVLLMGLQKPILSVLYINAEASVIANASTYFNIVIFSYPLVILTLIVFGILRGAGDTKTPMKITLLMNVVNIIFSFIFIYGLKLKFLGLEFVIPAFHIKGAALGIAAAYLTGAWIVLSLVFRGSRIVQLRLLEKFNWDRENLYRIFKVGFPAGLEQLLMSGGKLVLLVVIVGMGTVSIAAHSIGMSLMSLLYMPLMGFSIASTTLIGQRLGRADPNGAEQMMDNVTKLAMSIMVPVAIIIFIFPKFFYHLYTVDQEVIGIGSKIVRIFIGAFPFHILSMVISGSLRGAGDTRYCAFVTFLGVWAFRLLLGYILGVLFHLGIYGIWVGIGMDLVLRSGLFYARFKKGEWKNIRI